MSDGNQIDYEALHENTFALSESFGGMRRALIAEGYAESEAGALIVALNQQVAAEKWIEALALMGYQQSSSD